MAAETTTSLSNEVQTYYESKFLERAVDILIHQEGCQKSTHKKASGKTVRFNRYTPLARATTALTEGSNPSEVDLSSTTVDATLEEYGNTLKISKLLSTVSIDRDGEEKVEVMGQNMGETLDRLAREELYTGATVQLAAGKSALSDIAASDTLNASEIRKVIRELKKDKAMRYPDGFFIGKVGPDTSYDLMGTSTWENAKTYSDVKDLYKGEAGELHGARILETTDQKSESSTVTVYSNFFHGANAIGVYDLEGDVPQLYIKVPGPQSTDNPANRYSTISWAGSYVAKTLVADWLYNLKTAASA